MSELTDLIESFDLVDCDVVGTGLKEVRLFKESKPFARRPLLYNPGLCIVASGHKVAYVGEQTFRYDVDNYLVASVTMPFKCASHPGEDKPLLGVFVDIDMPQLRDLITQMDLQERFSDMTEKDFALGIGPSTMDKDMKDALKKLLKALRTEQETRILGPGLVREIYYRALCGSQAPMLYSLAMGSGSFSQVAQVINVMQEEYAKKLDVNQLANAANMSVSAFHKAFKEVTSDSPLQFLKKIRLARARDLIVQQRMKAYLAADEVGYESPSQFSREFKRYYGQSPAQVMREIRTA